MNVGQILKNMPYYSGFVMKHVDIQDVTKCGYYAFLRKKEEGVKRKKRKKWGDPPIKRSLVN